MGQPLVSVVCVCFNHEQFVYEAIQSVLTQTYSKIQLVVVDDCSNDRSVSIIEQTIKDQPNITFLQLQENLGICAAFNRGFALAKGDFITDFAADDVMFPQRMERMVNHFSRLDQSYGVVFSDAVYVDTHDKKLRYHTEHLIKKKLIPLVPEGWVFKDVLRRYFICPPTLLVRRAVFVKLNGYDENLAYEDFDFWVRSSREFKYSYLDEVLTKVRVVRGSWSSKAYESNYRQLHSTFIVCQKALHLCRNEEERRALLWRARYEFRHAILSGNKTEAKMFGQLEAEISGHNWQFFFFRFLSMIPFPWRWLRRKYHQLFFE